MSGDGMAPRRRDGVATFAASIALLGVVAAMAMFLVGPILPVSTSVLISLVVAGTLGVSMPLRVERRGMVQGYNLEEAVFVAALFTLPPGLIGVVMGTSALVGYGVRVREPVKISFNTGQVAVWASVGTLVFHLIAEVDTPVISLRGITGTLAAVAVANAVNMLALAELFRRVGNRPYADTVADAWRLNAITAVANTSFGLLLAFVARQEPLATVLASTLLVGLYFGYRGYARVLDERRRAESLHEATRSLMEVSPSLDATEGFLESLRSLFGAERAELGLLEGNRLRHWSLTDDGFVISEGSHGDRVAAWEAIRRSMPLFVDATGRTGQGNDPARRGGLAAPLVHEGQTTGALAVFDRKGLEPWDQSDLALLATLANETAVVLRNVELFAQVERERARWEEESTKLSDILTAASDGIAMFGPDGHVRTWNPAMTVMTGVAEDQAIGHPWFMVLRLRDEIGTELLPDASGLLGAAFRGERQPEAVGLQVLRRDGSWRWLNATFAPVVRDDDQPDGTVMVARDVTADRELEELKADFVATVSHELRTPLTPLKGFLSTLSARGSEMTQEQIDGVHEAMSTQVNRLEHLVSDLLVVADVDRQTVDLGRQAVELENAVRMAIAEEADAGAPARVRVEVARPASALGDESAVVRIMRALVNNACKHTAGEVVVSIDRHGGRAAVQVRDEGPGIPPWEHGHVFRRFYRLGDHLTRTQGPGLGLPIAQALAQRLGGEVQLESDVGSGSVFTLVMPAVGPRSVPDAAQREIS